MQPTFEDTRQALLKLLSKVAGTNVSADAQSTEVGAQIEFCIERVKAESSEGAALIDGCVFYICIKAISSRL